MNQPDDSRVPVRFGSPAAGEAVLMEGDALAPPGHPVARFRVARQPSHAPFCACCLPRGAAAQALGALFIARARGEVRWFDAVAVVATPAGEAAVRAALGEDQVSAGRFRLAGR